MDHLFYILVPTSIYLLIGQSFSIVYNPSKVFHIAHAAVISFGAYFLFYLTIQKKIYFTFSILLAITAATLIGIACELLIYKSMRKRNFPTFSFLIAGIGLYVILQNSLSLYFGDEIKIINITKIVIGNEIFGAYVTNTQVITIIISVSIFIVVSYILHFTASGKAIRAVASNPELCNIYGIDTNRIILIAFTIGSAIAAIAGILSAMDINMTPNFGFNLLFYGIVAMVIGGIGSISGLFVGSLMVATLQYLVAFYIDAKWTDAFTYIVLILFLFWKPLGFSGKRLKKVEI